MILGLHWGSHYNLSLVHWIDVKLKHLYRALMSVSQTLLILFELFLVQTNVYINSREYAVLLSSGHINIYKR